MAAELGSEGFAAAAEMSSASAGGDGPVMSLMSKRLRALRKKYNRILQMEERVAGEAPKPREGGCPPVQARRLRPHRRARAPPHPPLLRRPRRAPGLPILAPHCPSRSSSILYSSQPPSPPTSIFVLLIDPAMPFSTLLTPASPTTSNTTSDIPATSRSLHHCSWPDPAIPSHPRPHDQPPSPLRLLRIQHLLKPRLPRRRPPRSPTSSSSTSIFVFLTDPSPPLSTLSTPARPSGRREGERAVEREREERE